MNALTDTTELLDNACGDTPLLTIADAMRLLASWTDLAPGRAAKMRTALRTATKILAPNGPTDFAAAGLTMDCCSLHRLREAPAATLGLSKGRQVSLCSELRYILRRLGLHDPDNRGADLVSPASRACHDALPPHLRLAVIDFLRFVDAEGILPGQADSATLTAYRVNRATRTLCADPTARARQVSATWNWACQNVPDWPGRPMTPTKRAEPIYVSPGNVPGVVSARH
jgi:hypothetical protein